MAHIINFLARPALHRRLLADLADLRAARVALLELAADARLSQIALASHPCADMAATDAEMIRLAEAHRVASAAARAAQKAIGAAERVLARIRYLPPEGAQVIAFNPLRSAAQAAAR